MTKQLPDKTRVIKMLFCLLMAAQLVGCGGGSGTNNSSAVVPSEVVPGEVVPGEVVLGEVVPNEVLPSRVTLAWTAPVARADGSPLSLAQIGGYRVYYGTTEGDYPNRVEVNDGSAVEVILNDLPSGSYYFVVTTYDVTGRESEFSPVVTTTI